MLSAALDIGNTRIKWALFQDGNPLEEGTVSSMADFHEAWSGRSIATGIFAASGSFTVEDLPAGVQWVNAAKVDKLPFKMGYGSPGSLGADPLALAAAAVSEFPGQTILVVSCGTCITYNLLLEDGTYAGGHISPGWAMRLQAMHAFTAGLPMVEQVANEELPATTTHSNMQSGAYLGMLGELHFMIGQYTEQYPGLRIVLTGGDAKSFHEKLNFTIFARPGFLLTGLNSIHQLNTHP